MSITIKDIARELNISYSSVSRALNNKSGVSQKTRKKVLDAAKKMEYQPNDLARGLVTRASNTIGVIIPDIMNPFFAEITKGIMETANVMGYDVFLCVSGWDTDKEAEYIKALQEKRVDGIILEPSKGQKDFVFQNVETPMILLESWPNGKYSFVEVDNEKGGYIGAKHLIECGYKNIAFLGGREDSHFNMQRFSGFKKALEELGECVEDFYPLYGDFGLTSGYDLAWELFHSGKKVDAVFACNDVIALGVLQCAEELDKKIPEELGLIGFDNIVYARLPQIKLTTVHQPKYAMGKIALETLIEEIKGKDEERIIKKITLEPELIIRKTTNIIYEPKGIK